MMGDDSNLDMWDYWCDKHGEVIALRRNYPNLLEGDAVLRQAVAQIEMAKLAINARMKQLEDES